MPIAQSGGSLVTSANIVNDTIINEDVAANAGIAASKLGGGVLKKLSDDTLGGAATTFTTSAFSGVAFLKILIYLPSSPAEALRLQFNADTGNNYSHQGEENGTADGGSGSTGSMVLEVTGVTGAKFATVEVINISTLPKHVRWTFGAFGRTGSGWGLWNNTSNAIVGATLRLHDGGNLPTGTRIIVYGADLT